ncbi:MAG: nucleotide exchange factor GrpE [Thermostichales cyanobacterium SZTDM-1c_bins_54]
MSLEEKQPIPPEDAQPELEEEELLDDEALEDLVEEALEAVAPSPAPAPAAASEAPAPEPDPAAEVARLQHEIEVLRQQLKEKEDNYIRLYADFENFRRRTQREKEENALREKKKLLLEILPTVDNFERAALQLKPETERELQIHNSYQGVYRLLVENLKKLGVSKMKVVGQPFDPNLHEAVSQEATDDYPEGTVSQEYQAGYKLGDIVLRHALVVVAIPKTPAPEAAPEPTNPE